MYVKQLEYYGDEQTFFPYNLPFMTHLNELIFTENVTFITGENGSGKSTLIEAMAGLLSLNNEGGSRNNRFSTYDTLPDLRENCRLIRYPRYPKDLYFYRAESFYNLVSDLDQQGVSADLFDRNFHHFSRGESVKKLIKHRFFGNGLYLLDEPETGLSFQSQLELLVLIKELAHLNSQFIICTHSPVLLFYPDATIFRLEATGVKKETAKQSSIIEEWEMLFSRKEIFINQLLQEDSH